MSALTPSPSHKRIRVMEEREGDGEISDENEDADVCLTRGALDKMRTVVEESSCRKRKRALASDVQSKLMTVEAGLLNEEELLIEEKVGFDDEISENKEESMSARAVDVLDEQGTVEKEDQRMPKKKVDRKEEVVDEKRQKLPDDEEQSTFEEEEILEEEEDEMLAYLWPGSGRRSVV